MSMFDTGLLEKKLIESLKIAKQERLIEEKIP